MPAAATARRLLDSVPPASGGVVMGTGIVSVALFDDHRISLSRILLVLAGGVWLALGLVLARRVLADPDRVRREAISPAALTGVAATAVLGTRLNLLGWSGAGAVMLVVALALWLILLAPVLTHWSTPTRGESLLLTVSTESLATLAASLAAHEHAAWLLDLALGPFVLGLVSYAFVIARFDLRELIRSPGDHWITGGALAISTLAAGRITLAATAIHTLAAARPALQAAALTLWALTLAWLPVLIAAELLRPRLTYDLARWSTVFPVGMYAACSFLAGRATHTRAITDFAHVWVWIALAVWLATSGAAVRALASAVRLRP